MGKLTRREWIKPAMLVFGSQIAFAKDDKKTKRTGQKCGHSKQGAKCGQSLQGSKCGESVTRNGSKCGIRQGSKCKKSSIDHGRIGPVCSEKLS